MRTVTTMTTTTTNTRERTGVLPSLRDDRRRAGLTQLQLAVAANVSTTTVRNAEGGARVTADVRDRIEQALRLELQPAA